ncbi:hypothetical protein BDV93DRAFT_529288 [Ceratobasidium sp. AG-I]|nr:hypothetical protein BDV93DRAFT_529285 [Ceratobasidium sp. AG-I]KAF8594486.1 hypothetical protein BDV93DRAFT_529288 [Ceratobasidium sp. AG-I]
MESGLKRKLPASFARAQHQLEVLDTARGQINDLITDALLQLSVAREMESSNQTRKRRFEENLRVIPEYEIVNQEVVRSVKTRSMLGSQMAGPSFEMAGDSEDSVTICHRTGYFGNLRVSYRTFSSSSDDAAEERAEMELKVLSKALHPSVATLVGVTKGYYGLNGVVMAMVGLPHTEFLLKSVSGGALARFMKEIQEIADLFGNGYFGEHIVCVSSVEHVPTEISAFQDGFEVEGINIDHNGHVTVLPRPRQDWFGSQGIQLRPAEILELPHANTGSGLALTICQSIMRGYPRYGYPISENRGQMRRLADRLSQLGISFTKLDVTKIAAEESLEPVVRAEQHRFNQAPPFTLMHGDIVYPVTIAEGKRRWHVFEEGNEDPTLCGVSVAATNVHPELDSGMECLGNNERYLTWRVCGGGTVQEIGIEQLAERTTWQSLLPKITHASKHQSIDADVLSFCYTLSLTVKIHRPERRENEGNYSGPLYFHRDPSDRSNPRQFWGFFSADPDPYSSSTQLGDLGWTFEYTVLLELMHFRENWERIYERVKEREDVWIKPCVRFDTYEWSEDDSVEGVWDEELPDGEEPLDEELPDEGLLDC